MFLYSIFNIPSRSVWEHRNVRNKIYARFGFKGYLAPCNNSSVLYVKLDRSFRMCVNDDENFCRHTAAVAVTSSHLQTETPSEHSQDDPPLISLELRKKRFLRSKYWFTASCWSACSFCFCILSASRICFIWFADFPRNNFWSTFIITKMYYNRDRDWYKRQWNSFISTKNDLNFSKDDETIV